MAVVVQVGFGLVVLTLEADRVFEANLLSGFRTLFVGLVPCLVSPAPRGVAVLVGEFLGRAEVVALVPGQYVNRLCCGFVGPQQE